MKIILTMKIILINYCKDNVDINNGGVSVNIVNNIAAASDSDCNDADDGVESLFIMMMIMMVTRTVVMIAAVMMR